MVRRPAVAAAALGACLLLLACCTSPGWAGPAGRRRGARRTLLQAPSGDNSLINALGGISGELPGVDLPAGDPSAASEVLPTAPAAPAPAPDSSAAGQAAPDPNALGELSAADGGPPPCTDPSLLVTTMSTFCRLGSLEELRSLKQDAVQACCRLTSATLQPNCWDACAPPPAVSEPVLDVLQLWANICMVSQDVVCQESPGTTPAPSG